jgi:hypothetical protein
MPQRCSRNWNEAGEGEALQNFNKAAFYVGVSPLIERIMLTIADSLNEQCQRVMKNLR